MLMYYKDGFVNFNLGRFDVEKKQFEKAIYQACLKSALNMGSRIKTLSWFGKNHAKMTSEGKLAA
jgi:uncharacterized protein HemY